MNFTGIYLGDGTNYERLAPLNVRDFDVRYKTIEHSYRGVNGALGRQIIRGPIPEIAMNISLVSDRIAGILKGALMQRDPLYLYFSRGIKVVRQVEVMSTTTVLYLTPHPFSGITIDKVYEKSDFSAATNLYSSFNQSTRAITIGSAQTVGESVYVDYTWSKVIVQCTDLRLKPLEGAYQDWWGGSIKFEGV